MDSNQQGPTGNDSVGRFIGAVFGFVFLGIGVTVIGFLWSAPFGQFHSPPLFFRIFGSLIAVAFVAVGGGTAYAAITGKANPAVSSRFTRTKAGTDHGADIRQTAPSDGYVCDSCGAPLDSAADVSPHGDAKCKHCGRWFNIHA